MVCCSKHHLCAHATDKDAPKDTQRHRAQGDQYCLRRNHAAQLLAGEPQRTQHRILAAAFIDRESHRICHADHRDHHGESEKTQGNPQHDRQNLIELTALLQTAGEFVAVISLIKLIL